MNCKKCHKEIPDGSVYCNFCGKKQSQKNLTRRGNGLGTAYKRGSYWQAEITLGYYTNDEGKLKRKRLTKSGFKTKKEALEYITDLKSNKKTNDINFEKLWLIFRETAYTQLSESKQTAYRIAWNKIKLDLCFKNISDVTSDDLQRVTDKYGTSYYTKRDIKSLLSHLYKIALRDDYIQTNKASFIMLPALNSKERDIFTDKEIDLLWNDYNTTQSIITAHILLMLYTGMRPGELLTIKKSNINLTEQYLTGGIKTEKGKRRKIIIPNKIMCIVFFLLEQSTNDLLTTYTNDNDFYDEWAAKRNELKLNKNLVPYCCRHTYVTNCTKLRMSPAMLQELTGHEDYDTTLDYTHLSIKDRLDAVNMLK